MDHFTPFGARVEATPVISVDLRPRPPYWLIALICCLAWAMAILSLIGAGVTIYYHLSHVDQQIAWAERV